MVFQTSRLPLATTVMKVQCFLKQLHPFHREGMQPESMIGLSYLLGACYSQKRWTQHLLRVVHSI